MPTDPVQGFHRLSIPSAWLRASVIPVYNEATTMAEVIERVKQADACGLEKEIIVVDDVFTDGTQNAALNPEPSYRQSHRGQRLLLWPGALPRDVPAYIVTARVPARVIKAYA